MLKKGLIILSLTTFFVANHADAKEAHHKVGHHMKKVHHKGVHHMKKASHKVKHHKVGKRHSKHHKVESHKVEKTTSCGCKDTGKHGTQYIPPFYDQ